MRSGKIDLRKRRIERWTEEMTSLSRDGEWVTRCSSVSTGDQVSMKGTSLKRGEGKEKAKEMGDAFSSDGVIELASRGSQWTLRGSV